MLAMLRLLAITALISGLLYAALWLWLRSLRREALEGEWDAANPDLAGDGAGRRAFVARRMQGYDKSLRARLVVVVLAMPMTLMLLTAWLVNRN